MIFISMEELIEFVNHCKDSQATIVNEIQELVKEVDLLAVFDPKRLALKKKIKIKRKRFNRLYEDIKKCYERTELKFSSLNLAKFLASYLSIKEQEEYTVVEDKMVSSGNIVLLKANEEILQEQINTGNPMNVINYCDQNNSIWLDIRTDYSLLNTLRLSDNFDEYPYLKEVAFDLVNLSLANARKENEERLTNDELLEIELKRLVGKSKKFKPQGK